MNDRDRVLKVKLIFTAEHGKLLGELSYPASLCSRL
jgi:hypothetical protein